MSAEKLTSFPFFSARYSIQIRHLRHSKCYLSTENRLHCGATETARLLILPMALKRWLKNIYHHPLTSPLKEEGWAKHLVNHGGANKGDLAKQHERGISSDPAL